MPELDDISWDELAQSIADGEAVLLLGPDAIPLYSVQGQPSDDVDATTSFSKLSRNRILQTLNDKELNHFYERDNLFQFSSAPAKQKAMKEVRNVLREQSWLPDSDLLRQIVAIPFPVVVNINPDKYVYEAFLKYYREPQFDYFTSKDKPNPPVLDFPDGMNKPLVYNLCGSVLDKLDSVILDYFDLFELLKNILADQGVSEHDPWRNLGRNRGSSGLAKALRPARALEIRHGASGRAVPDRGGRCAEGPDRGRCLGLGPRA